MRAFRRCVVFDSCNILNILYVKSHIVKTTITILSQTRRGYITNKGHYYCFWYFQVTCPIGQVNFSFTCPFKTFTCPGQALMSSPEIYFKCVIVSWSSATGSYYSTAFLCSFHSKMAAAQSCHGCNCCYGAFYWVSPLGLLYSLVTAHAHRKSRVRSNNAPTGNFYVVYLLLFAVALQCCGML